MIRNMALHLRVKDQNGFETFFRVQRKTKMRKVFSAYATKVGVPLDALRFLLDGQRVDPADTFQTLELEDGDQIDCVLEQRGGA